jgi:AraC-like DNA-binding protein
MSGVRRWRLDGREVGVRSPAICVLVRGQHVDLAFDETRENWAIELDGFAPRAGPGEGQVSIAVAGGEAVLPLAIPLDPAELPGLRQLLRRMRDQAASPAAVERWRCDLAAGQLFARILAEREALAAEPAPEERLKVLLDDEARLAQPFAELVRRCGRSGDHLARRFAARYGLPPARYREERRMAAAQALVRGSALTVKEIAARVGYASHAAFTRAFVRACGETPSAAIARRRRSATD